MIHCGAETQGTSRHPRWAPGVLSVLPAEILGFPSRQLPEDTPFPTGDFPEGQAGPLGFRRGKCEPREEGGRGCSEEPDQPSALNGPAILLHRGQGDPHACLSRVEAEAQK